MKDLLLRIKEVAKKAETAGEDDLLWRDVLVELMRITETLQSRVQSPSAEMGKMLASSSVAKISTMCNPKLARILRAEAMALGKPPSRLVADIVKQFVSNPPAEETGAWWNAPTRVVRALLGRETLTAAVDPSIKEMFESMIPRVKGVTNKSQLLAWVIWNYLDRPTDRS
jgi:hypothetical protein